MILQLFRTSSPAPNIRDLYGAIVAQARKPAFYRNYGVPDTLEGRFDLIVLHLVLVLSQLSPPVEQDQRQAGGQPDGTANAIGQKLFDAFCRDLDDNLREMGVGDLTVPKRMRGFAEAFYGRQAAYLAAFAAPDRRELENTLARNIFGVTKADEGLAQLGSARLAAYVCAALSRFKAQQRGALEVALWRGQVAFPDPETVPEIVSSRTTGITQNEAIQSG